MPDPDSEILNIVDERDSVIGKGLRSEIHRLGLRHRSVHVLVFNRVGDLFLQRRAVIKESHPGLWDSSAAGHVDSRESYEQCAIREVREELGLDPAEGLQKLFKLGARPDTGMEFCMVYRLEHTGPLRLNPKEVQDGRWISPRLLEKWLAQGATGLTPTFKVIWSRVRKIF